MKIRFIITALFIVAALTGCASNSPAASPTAPSPQSPIAAPTESPLAKRLEVLQIFWGKSEGAQVIGGQVRNAGDAPLQDLKVEMYALDGGNQVIWATRLDIVPDKTDSAVLEPGDTASFGSLENVDLQGMKLYQYRFLTASGEVLQLVPTKIGSPSPSP